MLLEDTAKYNRQTVHPAQQARPRKRWDNHFAQLVVSVRTGQRPERHRACAAKPASMRVGTLRSAGSAAQESLVKSGQTRAQTARLDAFRTLQVEPAARLAARGNFRIKRMQRYAPNVLPAGRSTQRARVNARTVARAPSQGIFPLGFATTVLATVIHSPAQRNAPSASRDFTSLLTATAWAVPKAPIVL